MRLAFLFTLVLAVGVGVLASCSSDSTPQCVDRSAASADRTIFFGGTGASSIYTYNPSCMNIAAGQTVTFAGEFISHPLARGTVSDADAGSPDNPIPDPPTHDGRSLAVTYPSAGNFPYYCTQHTAQGMNGKVQVQ